MSFRHQALPFRTGSDGNKFDFSAGKPFAGLYITVQCISNPMCTRIANQKISVVRIFFQLFAVNHGIMKWLLPRRPLDPVWNINEFFRFHSMFHHMALGVRQKRNDIVTVPVTVIFCRLHHTDIRVMRIHPTQFDRAERPEIMHFIDQHSPILFCHMPSRVNIQRIRGGSDNRIGPALFYNLSPVKVKPAQKGQHVFNASFVVAVVFVSGNPEVPDSIDHLLTEFCFPQRGVFCTQMRIGTGDNGHIVALFYPPLCHVIRAEFHTMFFRARIMIDVNDVHRFYTPNCERIEAIFSEACPSPNGIFPRAAGSGTVSVALR